MCGRAPRDNHLMGVEPPVTAMVVVAADLRLPGAPVRTWQLAKGGELVIGVALVEFRNRTTVGYITTVDHIGEIRWRIEAGPMGIYATQSVMPGQEWSHFLDPLGRDVSPYVHAAVARVAAELLRLDPGRPLGNSRFSGVSQCVACHAFRILPQGDQVLGDAEGWVRTPSTGDLRDKGLWQAERYYCMARHETPEDIERLVTKANAEYTRGWSVPVLPLHYAGEECPYFLPKGAGRRGGFPAWEVPGGQIPSDNVDIVDRDGVRTLRVRAGFWQVEVPVKKNTPCAHTGKDN